MKKITYGILGCGHHALTTHALAGKEIPDLELTAIHDLSANQMARFEQTYDGNIRQFTDLATFLSTDIDAVLIGTPDEFHFRNLRDVIAAGKHVFIEKPLATNVEDVENLLPLLNEAQSKELVVTSCHLRRFDPPFMWLKENMPLLVKQFGTVNTFRFDFSYHRPVRQWKHDRGLLLDHANHEIDLLHYVLGKRSFEAMRVKDGFDHYQVLGMREDGISFEFSGTRRLESYQYPEWVSIRFDRGDVFLDAHKGTVAIKNHEDGSLQTTFIKPTDYSLRGRKTTEHFARVVGRIEDNYLTAEDLYVNTAFSVMLTHYPQWRYQHGNP